MVLQMSYQLVVKVLVVGQCLVMMKTLVAILDEEMLHQRRLVLLVLA
jgi:hypothetical protein